MVVLRSVAVHVLIEARTPCEVLVADFTREEFLPTVNSLVCFEASLTLEELAAEIALVVSPI